MAFDTTPKAHPFASTLNERGIWLDGSGTIGNIGYKSGSNSWSPIANGSLDVNDLNGGGDTFSGGRSAEVIFAGIFADVGANLPTSDARIVARHPSTGPDSGSPSHDIYYTTTGAMAFTLDGSTLVTTSALTRNNYYYIEWFRVKDAVHRWIIAVTDINGAAPWTRNIVYDAETVPTLKALNYFTIGDVTARGAGFAPQFWNVILGGWVDANNPPGVIRCDHMWANGVATDATYRDLESVNANDVDDTGSNIEPDGGTTQDVYTLAAGDTKKQAYTLTSPAYITSDDAILSCHVAAWIQYPATSAKITEVLTNFVWADGTTYSTKRDDFNTGSYHQHSRLLVSPSGATTYGLTLTDLTNMEIGYKVSIAGGGGDFAISEVSALIAYEKSGENMGALPAAKFAPALMKHRREQVMTLKDFTFPTGMSKTPYPGLFSTAVAPPSTPQHQRGMVIG